MDAPTTELEVMDLILKTYTQARKSISVKLSDNGDLWTIITLVIPTADFDQILLEIGEFVQTRAAPENISLGYSQKQRDEKGLNQYTNVLLGIWREVT